MAFYQLIIHNKENTMLQPVFDFIEKFSTDFTWKRLVIFMSLIVILIVIFLLYESQTATNQLSKYERSLSILKEVEILKFSDSESKEIKNNILKGLKTITNIENTSIYLGTKLSIELKQALLAASPWLLFCLFFIPAYLRKDTDASSIVGGTLALALIMGLGGYFIPPSWGSWIGFGLFPFGINLLIFFILMHYGNRK